MFNGLCNYKKLCFMQNQHGQEHCFKKIINWTHESTFSHLTHIQTNQYNMIYKCYLIDMYTFIYWKRAKVFFSVPYMTTPLSMTFEETKLCLKNLVKYTFGPYFTFPNLTYMKLLVIFNNLFFNKLFHL